VNEEDIETPARFAVISGRPKLAATKKMMPHLPGRRNPRRYSVRIRCV
jgi:hypothetical protein